MRVAGLRGGLVAAALACAALASASGAGAAEHVIQISLDGLSAQRLQALIAADTSGDFASFERFLDEGASTWNARCDYTHSITLPNHTSMLTGRPVSQPSGQPNTVHHGWTSNDTPPPGVTLHNGANPNLAYIPSVFDVVHDHGLSTALYVSKSKFVLYERSYDAAHGAPDALAPDHGTDKIDVYVNTSAASMHSALLSGLAAHHFAYAFVHYSTADDTGHASGWSSTAYANALRTLDDQLAQLFALIESDPVLDGHTLLILSADHGGTGSDHSNATLAANYTIPFFVWGDGVEPGSDLYALNAHTRADPSSARPPYGAALQPIRNGDGGNLALAALGLPPVPGSSIDASQDLQIGLAPQIPLLAPAAALVLALLLAGVARGARPRIHPAQRR
jgi:Type I phosphodiesterase / nucleotide pyrophosphatase